MKKFLGVVLSLGGMALILKAQEAVPVPQADQAVSTATALSSSTSTAQSPVSPEPLGGASAGEFVLSSLPSPGAAPSGSAASDLPWVSTGPALRPSWAEKAGHDFERATQASSRGDFTQARKWLASALKRMAREADPEALAAAQNDIQALLARVEAGPEEILGMGEEELSSAPAISTTVPTPLDRSALVINREDPLVKTYVSIYSGAQHQRFQEALDRLARYRPMISKKLAEAKLPPALLYVPLVESEYQSQVVSRAGAAGLWQFMPQTGRGYGLKVNYWQDERFDPERATDAALRCLKDLHEWFDDWSLALAAYNRGVYGIERDLRFTRAADFSLLARRDGLPLETEHYLPKWMAALVIMENPSAYGFSVSTDAAVEAVDEVTLDKPLDLKIAAEAAGLPESEIRRLNPSLRLWCTPKAEGSFVLRVPGGTRESFLAHLQTVKDWTPSPGFIKYQVRKGDILGKIAAKYRTTASTLQKDNNIRNPRTLRPGQTLVIRPGRTYAWN